MTSHEASLVGEPVRFCGGHAQFTTQDIIQAFRVQNETIVLRHDPEVFPPSSFGLRFAEQIDFRDCRRAADIGTGTGLLAILAAKKGVVDVKATDLSERAVQLSALNAMLLNGVASIEARQGHFFGDLTGVFDVITANLPQEILPPAYRSTLSCLQSQAIDGGGAGGNSVLLDFLDVAPRYMHASTKLYVIVNTITDYRSTLRYIDANYSPVLVWEGLTSVKSFVRDNIGFFRSLIELGTVSLLEDEDGNWHARQFIYRLALKSSAAASACEPLSG